MVLQTYKIIPSPDTSGTTTLANGYAKATITGTGATIVEFWKGTKIGSESLPAGAWTRDVYLQLGFGSWTVTATDNSVPPVSLPEFLTLTKPLTGHITGVTAVPSTNPSYPASEEWIAVTVTGSGPVEIQYIKGWLRGTNVVTDPGTWTLTDWLKLGFGTYTIMVSDGTNSLSAFVNNPAPTPTKWLCSGAPFYECTLSLQGTFNSQAECQASCSNPTATKYSCVNGTCIEDPAGTFTSLAQCQGSCGTQVTKYSCVNGSCVVDPAGQYTSITACQAACTSTPPPTTKGFDFTILIYLAAFVVLYIMLMKASK